MTVLRVNKTSNYTVMSNYHLREKEMSLKAKGLLSLMLSLPDDWDYSIMGLATLSKDGKDSVMATLNELEEFGYLVRTRVQAKDGKFEGYIYDIYESPNTEKPQEEKPYAENPNTVNPPQINTNNTNNTKKTNTKKINKDIDSLIIEFANGNNETFNLLNEWLSIRKQKRAANTVKAIELNLKKLVECASKSNMTINEYLEEVIMRGWQAFYVINNGTTPKAKPKASQGNEYANLG